MTDFSGFGLPPALVQTLERMQYRQPTPIQAQAIPPALEGRDILGSAQTGTGKTAAFGIPLVTRLMNSPRGSALILTPTRELAMQVVGVLRDLLGGRPGINAALLIGGEPMNPQLAQLRLRPRLIVGTPGRINDHLARGTLMLHDAGFLVLDETDRMLDMGFIPQIEQIMRYLPKVRQTLLFSATLPDNIVRLSEKYLTGPVRVSVGAANAPTANVSQAIVHVDEGNKYPALLKELDQRRGSILVFVKTKYGAERLAKRLNKQRYSADAIHGDLQQNQRKRVIDAFRAQEYRIMVATDIAARGLDIPHIEHVINYDLPTSPEDYIHRIGRTARAGAEGASVCMLSPEDGKKWRAIQLLMHPEKAAANDRQAGGSRNGTHGAHGGKTEGGQEHNPFRARRRRSRNRHRHAVPALAV